MAKYVVDSNGDTFKKEEYQVVKEDRQQQAQKLKTNQNISDVLAQLKERNQNVSYLGDIESDPRQEGELSTTLDKAVDWLEKRNSLKQTVENAVRTDPSLLGGLREAILESTAKKTGTVLETLSRTLNFFPANEAGLLRGIVRQLRGEGTVYEGWKESVSKNEGFGALLKELGVPEGPSITPNIPLPHLKGSGLGAFGVAEHLARTGEVPLKFNLFTPLVTARGTAGLALDIIADPITYISFGAKPIIKAGVKTGEKSLARFAGATLLKDKQFEKALLSMRSSKVGQATLEALDAFAAIQLTKNKSMGKVFTDTIEAFVPGFGQNKTTYDYLRRVERNVNNLPEILLRPITEMFRDVSKEDRALYFLSKFRTSKSEKTFRDALRRQGLSDEAFAREAAKFGRRLFPAKAKLQEIDNALFDPKDGIMTRLSKEAGFNDDDLFQNYIPSLFEDLMTGTTKGVKTGTQFQKVIKTKSKLEKNFVEENLIKDPVTALGTRALELATLAQVNKAIKTVVRGFGDNFGSTREALEAGYREFYPEGFLRFFKKEIPETGEEILSVAKTKPKYLPENVLKAIEDFSKRREVTSNVALKAMDSFNQQFKAFVTSVWPAFHARNAFSNRILRFLNEGWKSFKVGDDLDAIKILGNSSRLGTEQIETALGKKISLETVKNWAKRQGITNSNQFWVDIGGGSFDVIPTKELSGRLRDFVNPIAGKNNFVKLGRNIGTAIEDQAKLASFIRAIKDGYHPKEAADLAFAGLFDYSNLTAFERNVMRRIFPFYTFGRKNIELQVKTLLTNPSRQGLLFKTMKDIHNEAIKDLDDEQLEAFNEYKLHFLKNSFAIPAGVNREGDIMWATGFGLPQEDMFDLFSKQGLFFRANPLLKGLANELSGVDLGRTLSSNKVIALKDSYTVPELQILLGSKTVSEAKEQYKNHPIAKMLGLKVSSRPKFKEGVQVGTEPVFIANPRALNAIRSTFIARFLNSAKALGDPNISDTQNLMRFMTGISMVNHDIEQAAARDFAERREATTDILKQSGEGGEFRKSFAGKKAPREIKQLVKILNKKLKVN